MSIRNGLEEICWVASINARGFYVFGNNGAGTDNNVVAYRNWENRGIAPN